jgi:hypothetical protein
MNFLSNPQFFKLEIFVPTTNLEQIAAALNSSGAGASECYDNVFSYSLVKGRWRPLPGANPYRGKVGQLYETDEYKIEVCCSAANLAKTIAAIKAAHPYEEPLINVIALAETNFGGSGGLMMFWS